MFFEDFLRFYSMSIMGSSNYNWILNTIGSLLLFLITSSSIAYWKELWHFLMEYVFMYRCYNTIELHGSVLEDRNEISIKFSEKLKSIIYYINTHCMEDTKLKRLLEVSFNNYYCFNPGSLQTEYMINQNIPLKLAEDIDCSLRISCEDLHLEKRIVKLKEITLKVYSKTLTVSCLRDFLKGIEEEYEEYIKMNMHNKTFCFLYSKSDESGKPVFISNSFHSTKTFDNLVFRDKQMLQSRLDFYLRSKEFYNKLGIPYTLGLLFHGYPGTGKTSTIKAIANYTKRHLIIIPMNKIKNFSTLRDIILSDEIADFKIPHHKRLYIFEEIDCNGMEKLISKRSEIDLSSKEQTEVLKEFLSNYTNQKPVCLPPNKSNDATDLDKITLGGLLELLDGINEAPGRILIMTTNTDPSTFDTALLRPGRIDYKIEFKKCNHQELNELYKLWFNIEIPNHILEKIPEHTFSPAELGEIFIRFIESPDTILQHLTTYQTLENEHVI